MADAMADVDKITTKEMAQRIRTRDTRFLQMPDAQVVDWAIKQDPELANHLIDYNVGPTSGAAISGPARGVGAAREIGYRALDIGTQQLPNIAAALGAVAGSPAGGWGAVPLAGAGGMAGAGARDYLRSKFLYEPRRSLREELPDLFVEGATQALTEGIGRAAARPLTNFARKMRDTAEASRRIPLLPSQAGVGGTGMSWMEKFSAHAIPSAGVMKNFFERQNAKALAEIGADINAISNYRGTSEELGELVQKSVDSYRARYRQQVLNPLYEEIDSLIKQSTVRVPTTVTRTSSILDAYGNPISYPARVMSKQQVGGVFVDTTQIRRNAIPILRALQEQAKYLDPKLLADSQAILAKIVKPGFNPRAVPFSVMKDSRSDLLALSRNLEEALPGKRAGIVKKLIGSIDAAMEDSAQSSGIPGLLEKFRTANALNTEFHRKFDQDLLKRILDTRKPELISAYLRKAGLQEIRDAEEMIPDDQFQAVAADIMRNILSESVDQGTGLLNPGKFAKAFYTIGEARGQELFGASYDAIHDLANLLDKLPGQRAGHITIGSGAAGLHNLSYILGLGHAIMGASIPTAVGLGAETAALRTFAEAITHPATAAKVSRYAAAVLHGSPYAMNALTRYLFSSPAPPPPEEKTHETQQQVQQPAQQQTRQARTPEAYQREDFPIAP